MPSEPAWVEAGDIASLNIEIVRASGEPHQVRDLGLLESACAVPTNRFFYEDEADVVRLATALMLAIARNHPFQQGNKRTAFAAGELFLQANGYSFDFEDTVKTADLFVEVIQGHIPPEALEAVLRDAVRALDP